MSARAAPPLDRRGFLGGLTGAVLGASTGCRRPGGTGDGRPNILFLLADQLRWDALSVNGNRIARTPNLDRFAAGAVNFRQAICPAPLCGPSRAGMLTGRLIRVHGGRLNRDVERPVGMQLEVSTYDQLLRSRGYHCEYHGKWHTGSTHLEPYAVPPGDFLEEYRVEMLAKHGRPVDTRGWSVDVYTKLPYRPFPVDRAMRDAAKEHRLSHRPECGETYLPAEDSLTAWTAQRVLGALRAASPRPFCITGSFLAPHSPLIAPAPYASMFDPREMPAPANLRDELALKEGVRCFPEPLSAGPEGLGQLTAIYNALVVELDRWIGEILAGLDDLGLSDDTLVVFASDHGELLGSHGMLGKAIFFEEALRIPLLVRPPGGGSGAESPACVTGRDLFATLLDYAGVDLPAGPLACRSLRSVIEGGPWDGDFAVSELGLAAGTYGCVRAPRWKLMPHDDRWVLFDLGADPAERRDALGDGPAARQRARELRNELSRYLAAHGDEEGAARLPEVE